MAPTPQPNEGEEKEEEKSEREEENESTEVVVESSLAQLQSQGSPPSSLDIDASQEWRQHRKTPTQSQTKRPKATAAAFITVPTDIKQQHHVLNALPALSTAFQYPDDNDTVPYRTMSILREGDGLPAGQCAGDALQMATGLSAFLCRFLCG
jgi:hypothetical protein